MIIKHLLSTTDLVCPIEILERIPLTNVGAGRKPTFNQHPSDSSASSAVDVVTSTAIAALSSSTIPLTSSKLRPYMHSGHYRYVSKSMGYVRFRAQFTRRNGCFPGQYLQHFVKTASARQDLPPAGQMLPRSPECTHATGPDTPGPKDAKRMAVSAQADNHLFSLLKIQPQHTGGTNELYH